jgi:hypothetical protein
LSGSIFTALLLRRVSSWWVSIFDLSTMLN